MGDSFFEDYINYLFRRARLFFYMLIALVIIQYFFFLFLFYRGIFPIYRISVPEWLVIAFQLSFVALVLFIQYFLLSNSSLSRFLSKAVDKPPPPSYRGNPKLFPLIRTYTVVFFLRLVQLIASTIPAVIGGLTLITGYDPGNFTSFTVVSIGLLFFSMPSSRFKKDILSVGKFIENGSPELTTGSKNVSPFTDSDENGES